MEFRLGATAFIAVFATYLLLSGIGVTDPGNNVVAEAPYNLLARGILKGHLYLDKPAPEFLQHLPNPYDPAANAPARDPFQYRLSDLTYYRNRIYMYFGVAPALAVFIPWHLLTGAWLLQWAAVLLLCVVALLVNFSLFRAVRGRIFPAAAPWTSAAAMLVLGFASYAPLLLARADMWEVPLALDYLAVAVALRCLWEAAEQPAACARWLAGASAAFGVAFASRPTVLPNAAILLLPFLLPAVRRRAMAWVAAGLPLLLCGVGVAWYNAARFGSPFEFGVHYMLLGAYYLRPHSFDLRYIPANLHSYLWRGVEWTRNFPYVERSPDTRLAGDYAGTEHVSGILADAPILWMAAFTVFWAARRPPGAGFRLLAAAAGWVAFSSLALLACFVGANGRYELEFAPALALLAALGIPAAEALCSPALLRVTRWAGGAALLFSCAVLLLYGLQRAASDHNTHGVACLFHGDIAGAEHEFGTATFLAPGNPRSRIGMGFLRQTQGRLAEAHALFAGLAHDYPAVASNHLNLANLDAQEARFGEAEQEYQLALGLDPADGAAQAGLAAARQHLAK
jgi:hypothetical protein